jgi:hypothetical protein
MCALASHVRPASGRARMRFQGAHGASLAKNNRPGPRGIAAAIGIGGGTVQRISRELAA